VGKMSENKEELKSIIQGKKESKDYYTIQNGLETERQCFEAIEATGHRLYVLKEEIQKKLDAGAKPETDPQFQAFVIAAQEVHNIQGKIVNDVCERFEVIHPEYENPKDCVPKPNSLYYMKYGQ
jgi:hypothetical protein